MANIINLKDYADTKEYMDYKFIKAFATNSRLLGVIGIRLHYSDINNNELILLFHLDYEEYGFDRFQVIENSDYERMTKSIIGGLGAELVNVTLEEASTLIYDAINVGDKYLSDIPVSFYDYEYLLDEECRSINKEVLSKVCSEIISDEELINYFIMRTVGRDNEIIRLMLTDELIDYSLVEEPTVLLKNEITRDKNFYVCKSIIDYNDSYKMIISKIEVEKCKVVNATKVDEMLMTYKEAAFQLNKKEFLAVFYVESAIEFRAYLEGLKPELLKNIYESGSLYTEFNKNNNHVNSKTYYLNGDVYGSYFITNEHHVLVSCFDYDSMINIKKELLESFSMINDLAELEAEVPILYDFISSNCQDFFIFLGE